MQAEAQQTPVLSEDQIGQILREEYERAKAVYEQECAALMEDVNVDDMILLEEEIRKEALDREASHQDAEDPTAMQVDM